MFKKESLEALKEKIDLIELLEGHLELKRAGSAYKALCPFHEEKTPSFHVQRGDSHYHCFGCGAHGDAIQFLMEYLNLSFVEAVESLAEKFQVPLEREEERGNDRGVNKKALKEACEGAAQFYNYYLMHSEEGKEPLQYLFKRGITIDFIQRFGIGLAPAEGNLFLEVMQGERIDSKTLAEAGLVGKSNRPFFRERILFPIRNGSGQVIGFSGRKYREETFGGKYINTPETPLFKKSKILFGLNYCRRRIAKERRAIIVEGQIDCLKLIEAGLNVTVAALGTAFGEGHVQELKQLGVREIFLLFDGDEAGNAAISKAGNLFQKVGLEVKVVQLPKGYDPDSYLTKFGVEQLIEELGSAQEYLTFQVVYLGRELNLNSPAGKAELVKVLKKQIDEWEEPVMVHESLRKIASLVQIPEEMISLKQNFAPNLYIKREGGFAHSAVDPNRVLELDLLRWLVFKQETFLPTARHYLKEEHFWTPVCQTLFKRLSEGVCADLLSLAADLEDPSVMDEILQKKVNRDRAEKQFVATVQKLLDRQWMEERRKVMAEMEGASEEKILELTKQYDALKGERPKVILIETEEIV